MDMLYTSGREEVYILLISELHCPGYRILTSYPSQTHFHNHSSIFKYKVGFDIYQGEKKMK